MEIRRFFVWNLIFLVSGLAICSLCPESDNESLLQINNVYTYQFRSEALAQAVGTTQDQGKITLQCDVHVAHERACFYHLDLHNCLLTATGGEPGSQTAWIPQQHLPDLSKYPVAFTLSNGEITEVKTHDEDPLFYVNIKRGVLSAFVFKLSQTKEEMHESHTDIHGTCPLTSVPLSDAEGTVRTSKDMLLCNYPSRPDWQFSPWSLFWNMSFIQHVINSTTDCDYKINENLKRIDKVFCKERHAIMLESTHRTTTAVQTNIFYYLDFVKVEAQSTKPAFPILTRKTGIQFEYEHTSVPQSSPPNFLPLAKKMLSDLVLDSLDEIRLFTIPQFTNFVSWIRSSANLRPLVDSVSDCSFLAEGVQCDERVTDLAFSYLSDALLQCNNIPCAKTLTYLVMSDRLTPSYLNFIFQSWSYMHYSKPGFITNFADICRLKNSNQCWMSLGSFVHRIYKRSSDLDEKILQEIQEVSSYFYNRITEECEVSEDADKDYSNCLMILKAISNIGNHYSKIMSDGINQLLELATEEDLPTVVRTSALEALSDVFDPNNQEQKQIMYDRLLPIMMNVTLPASIRIFSYNQLLHVSHGYNFQEHLLEVLKNDKSTEVKYYVAQSVNSLMTDSDFKSRRFLHSLKELLQENNISLDRILYNLKAKSKSSSYTMFFNLPFMSDYMKQFGVKLRDSLVYDAHIYPTIFSKQSIFQLFSTFLSQSKVASYAEGWEELILAFRKNLGDMNSQPISFSKIYSALMEVLKEYGKLDEESLRNFDNHILANLKQIHKLYWEHHKKLIPYTKAYLDLFGSTVKYFVENSFKSGSGNQGIERMLHNIGHKLAEGVTFNTSRVIRVIEAYHQVPTMMGLPLNWTTDATLAFSFRTGLRLQMNKEKNHIHSKGFLQPSAALTFLNRMVLDFPTFTQIGVQANSSAYTSTEFRGQFSSADGKQTLRFDRPSRTQKFLELFRSNQLIKHNNYEEIPDWDIERTFSSWCTKDSSTLGMKFCLAKSYPNVTHRIKPWALMAGWCKWQFSAHPTSRSEVHYDLELHQASKQSVKEMNAKFTISDNNKERSSSFKASLQENAKDMKLELKTSVMPEFLASFSISELSNKKAFGHKTQAVLKLAKDFKYEVEYIDEGKIQKSSTQASYPLDEDEQKLINEEHLDIKTPFSLYKWSKSVFKMGENAKAEAFLSYEKFKGENNWMKGILPSEFWENDNKAFLKVLLHWKKPIYSSQDTVTRQTEFRIQIPRYVMTLNGYSLEYTGRQQVIVNLAKMDVNHGKLNAFLNFTYDYWANRNDNYDYKDIHLFNVTIPQRSWSAMYESAYEHHKYTHAVILKRAVMKPINGLKAYYIGWWSDEISERFKIEEQEIKLISNIERQMWSSDDIANRFPTVTKEDIKGLSNSAYATKVVLYYPFNDRTEKVDFDGYFIISKGDTVDRFQKTFDMISTYNNLKLTSHSVLRMDEGTTLYHNSYFTHLTTDTKAYNTIHFVWNSINDKRCSEIEFNHNIRSHVFDLSTDATYKCESDIDGLHTLRLKINTNSSKWNMLDMKLDQVVENVSPDYTREEMTTTHALGTIHVDAEWTSLPYHHQKHVTFCSKNGDCPNAELFLEDWTRDWNLKFSRPDYDITYRNRLTPNYKTLHVEVGYGNKVEGESPVLDVTGEILNRNFHVWKGSLNRNSFNKVKDIFTSGYGRFSNAVKEVAIDKDHPLNEMLQPALKMTLYDYWNSLKAQNLEFLGFSWSEVKEVFWTLDAFMEPAYSVIVNSATVLKNTCTSMYNRWKDTIVPVWALDYFHVPYYIGEGIKGLPQGLDELWNQLSFGEENVLHFQFFTGKYLSLSSFREWAFLEFDPANMDGLMSFTTNYKRNDREKIGMLFGPLHVYTFDGHVYDVPEYPDSECTYLLAHDVHKSLFTALTSKNEIHLLFPEMSVTINDKNEVFVNQSRVPKSFPIQSDNGKVTVKKSHVVEVWTPSLTVICRSHDFICILKLSDYHAGGIIGLLGNADENPFNDLMLLNGTASLSFLEFVSRYEVSGKPECQKLEVTSSTPQVSDDGLETCYKAFGSICSRQPEVREKFLKSCVEDVKAGYGACYATAGLSALCNFKYSPSHVDCNENKQESEQIGRKLEVVLVVQETKYLTSTEKSNAPIKGIESLVTAIDNKFKEDGYDSIKYSIVGFGGNGVHYLPTVHSSQASVWLESKETIDTTLKALEFKSREEADGVAALKYALEELGHDSFSSKVFVMITAKDKQIADKPLMNYVHTFLEENGITLYTFSSYPSIEKGKKVFGVRADGLIFPSQAEDGDAYLDYPRGNLAKLTSSTRGSVFLTKFLKDNQPSSFFSEFAQEVWAKVNKEAKMCRSCEPVRGDRWWWYRNKCNIVHC